MIFLPLFTIPQFCGVCEPNHYYMVCSATAIQVNCPGPNFPFNIWSSVHMPVNSLNAIYTSTCFVLTECQAYLILWEVLTVDLCLRGYSINAHFLFLKTVVFSILYHQQRQLLLPCPSSFGQIIVVVNLYISL
jgi:hypothetical protein